LLHFRGISKELQLQGILGNFSAWAGTLEDGALVYEVNDRAKGLAVVQSELELCLLLKLCAIGWFAEDELIWRQYYPAKSGDAMPGFDFEEIKKLLEAANRHLHPWWATIFKRA
jgi:hypothetical protein